MKNFLKIKHRKKLKVRQIVQIILLKIQKNENYETSNNKKNFFIKTNIIINFRAFNCIGSLGGDDFDYDADPNTINNNNTICKSNNNNNDIRFDIIDSKNYLKTTTLSITNSDSLNIYNSNNINNENSLLVNDNEEEKYSCGIMIMGKNGECDILTDEEKEIRKKNKNKIYLMYLIMFRR